MQPQPANSPAQSASIRSTGTRVNCPVCGPAEQSLVGICNGLPVVSCGHCSLTFVAECPPPDETETYFRNEYVPDREVAKTTFVDSRGPSLARDAARIRRLLPKGGRLLDVGTAAGFFLRQFSNHPEWTVEGVEPSSVAANYARQNFNATIHDGFLADQNFPASSFDVVCSLDAFCCHRTPREDMQEFNRLLAPGGFLAIEIPGHRFRMLVGSGFLYRLFTGKSLRLNAGVNFFYFTRETLTKLAALEGLELIASFPESMPRSSNPLKQAFRSAFDLAAATLYRFTGGRVNYCSKELCIFQKPHLSITAQSSPAASETQQPMRRAG